MDAPFLDLSFYVGLLGGEYSSHEDYRKSLRSDGADIELDVVHRSTPGKENEQNELFVWRTEADIFCGPMRKETALLNQVGSIVFKSFIAISEAIECYYGAILVEYSLETPRELRKDPTSLAFQNFFLNTERLPLSVTERVMTLVPKGSYVLQLERGVYVSMSMEFNPDSAIVDSEIAQTASSRIGTVIADFDSD